MNKQQHIQRNESGMVAITITIMLMLVISLIVLGYTANNRSELRKALDYNLSAQAFFAAESGINMAANKLKNNVTPPVKQTCDETEGGVFNNGDYTLDAANKIAITCILIDPVVPKIQLPQVGMNSQVKRINTNGQSIDRIHIGWQNQNSDGSSSSFSGCTHSPNQFYKDIGAWSCSEPLLRVDIVDIRNGNGIQRMPLLLSQFSAFLYPMASGGATSVSYNTWKLKTAAPYDVSIGQGVSCSGTNTPTYCGIDIVGLPSSTGPNTQYAIRVMGLYRTAGLEISAYNGSTQLQLYNAQAVVDVTAKAQDVLKRLRAIVSLSGGGDVPDFALAVNGDICKEFRIFQYNNTGPAPIAQFDAWNASMGTPNPACQLN